MGRIPETPRLADVSPAECGRRAAALARKHSAADSVTLAQNVEILAMWAAGGDRKHRPTALFCLESLTRFLFSAPLLPQARPRFDHEDPLQLVMAAARARRQLETGKPVASADLAALAGFDRSRPRQLVRAGILRRCSAGGRRGLQDAPIRNDDACKLLKQRRVPGFEP